LRVSLPNFVSNAPYYGPAGGFGLGQWNNVASGETVDDFLHMPVS
jgi:hypothetical protein